MLGNSEPRRTGKCGRGSEVSFSGDSYEINQNPVHFQTLQTRHIAARFAISDALAKLVAEMAFDHGRLR